MGSSSAAVAHRAIAQRAAARLADCIDPDLPAQVERALVEEALGSRSLSFDPATTIALASFVLAAAQFGWQVYRDLRADREEQRQREAAVARRQEEELVTPVRELLLRRMRLELPPPEGMRGEEHGAILAAVSREILEEGERA